MSTKILLTGKYLNAIHETGKFLVVDSSQTEDTANETEEMTSSEKSTDRLKFCSSKKLVIPNAVEIHFTTKEEVYKSIVENAYNYSSEVLLNLLLKEHKLMDRLRLIKQTFTQQTSYCRNRSNLSFKITQALFLTRPERLYGSFHGYRRR